MSCLGLYGGVPYPRSHLSAPGPAMIKVTITLPNGVQITVESDSEIGPEILNLALRDLPQELLSTSPPITYGVEQSDFAQLSRALSQLQSLLPPQDGKGPSSPEVPGSVDGSSPSTKALNGTDRGNQPSPEGGAADHGEGARINGSADSGEDSFLQFCRSVNPLGDMRRVVVAAEGAERFLQANGVDAEELSRLFDLVGWTQPHDFAQTLRNAARSKFRWLERMPGRSGRYWVTKTGKEIIRQG